MGGGLGGGGGFGNTGGNKEQIKQQLKNLPKNPDTLLKQGWKETSHAKAAAHGKRSFVNTESGLKVRFDKGVNGQPGFRGMDHYHASNPNATGKADAYLDINGNPVSAGSNASHLLP